MGLKMQYLKFFRNSIWKKSQKKLSTCKSDDSKSKSRNCKRHFSSITNKYDFLNRLLSLRQDLTWRKKTVSK